MHWTCLDISDNVFQVTLHEYIPQISCSLHVEMQKKTHTFIHPCSSQLQKWVNQTQENWPQAKTIKFISKLWTS